MHTQADIPAVVESAPLSEALLEMSAKKLGMTAVVDGENRISGIFTDGDLRRLLTKTHDLRTTPIADVMTRRCTTATPDMLAAEALAVMERKKINGLLVADEQGRLVGALNMHDLLRSGIV